MATRAYFMVNVTEKSCQNGYQQILKDLEAIPDVKSVERVSGAYDFLVKVDSSPSRMVSVANKIKTNEWANNLRIMYVAPIQPGELEGLNIDDLIWLKRVTPMETS